MPYVHISRIPGLTFDGYRTVRDAMGADPIAGQLLHAVGEADGALQIVDVWESKAEADRFAGERLFPAFERTGMRPGSDASYVAFDAAALDGVTAR